MRRNPWVTFALLLAGAIPGLRYLHAQTGAEASDPYLWLEDVHGDRAMAWVKAENERSAKVLQSDPHYAALDADALKVLESPERLPMPSLNGADVYNTWQDAQHQRGILRRTTLSDYLAPQPHWQTVVDFDALAKLDNQKWVSGGRVCLYPGNELCMLGLSAGGEDAVTLREFNLKTREFVTGGFVLPRSKQVVAWMDKDTLLVGRDWGPGTMTKSGYPFVVKQWKRGQPVDSATEVFRGKDSDVGVQLAALHDREGHSATIIDRAVDFFSGERMLLTPAGPKKIGLPAKATVAALLNGQLIVGIDEEWRPDPAAKPIPAGSVLALDLEAVKKDPAHLKPTVIFAPSATEFVQGVAATRDHLLLTTLENVQGRVYAYTRGANGQWTRQRLSVPDNLTVSIASTNWADNQFFLSLTGFLTPPSLMLGDAATGTLKPAKSQPAQFDASADLVEQLWATSKDGTKVPYFVVRRKDMRYDGSNPTLLTAYGGFEVSETPTYSAIRGKLWLERGGVLVLANIRGGGEFGPAWHEAGLKTHRQRIYDDFAAVAQDLVARRITSSKHLGIEGGSNGGLLMGVEMTQHPEMWGAVVIDIPLLDMLRFEHIAAGASWVGEYGSVSVPAERAFLASISPYNQLKPNVNYPEPLIFTTTADDRVGPVHARKFAARMEEYHKPFFYEEITEGGHGTGADLKERAGTYATEYTYLTRKLMQ